MTANSLVQSIDRHHIFDNPAIGNDRNNAAAILDPLQRITRHQEDVGFKAERDPREPISGAEKIGASDCPGAESLERGEPRPHRPGKRPHDICAASYCTNCLSGQD